MIFLIGGRGRLGQAIAAEYSAEGLVSLPRPVYENWWRGDAADAVSRYFEGKADEGSVVFVASGLLDPSLPPEELWRINLQLPRNVVEGVARLGVRTVTFGTVMEGLVKAKNPYIRSKAALGEYMAGVAAATGAALHLRVHTLYGGEGPSPFMFLGQMLDAIRSNRPFMMTAGRQLREYHHLEDEAGAIRKIVDAGATGVVDVSHGQAVRLREIAESVFGACGKMQLARFGALSEPPEENYGRTFERPGVLDDVAFRDSLSGIVAYMQDCLARADRGGVPQGRLVA